MGLAASQARLLTLTSRCIDLELKCMRFSNQQIRNAQKACELSEDYNMQLDMLADRYDASRNAQSSFSDDNSYIKTISLTGMSAAQLKNSYGITLALASPSGTGNNGEFDPNSINYESHVHLVPGQSFASSQKYSEKAMSFIASYGSSNFQKKVVDITSESYALSLGLNSQEYHQVRNFYTSSSHRNDDNPSQLHNELGNRFNSPNVNQMHQLLEDYYNADKRHDTKKTVYKNEKDVEQSDWNNALSSAASSAGLNRAALEQCVKNGGSITDTQIQQTAGKYSIDYSNFNGQTFNGYNQALSIAKNSYKMSPEYQNYLNNPQGTGDSDILSEAESDKSKLWQYVASNVIVLQSKDGSPVTNFNAYEVVEQKEEVAVDVYDKEQYKSDKERLEREYDNQTKRLSLEDKKIQAQMTQVQTELNACNSEIQSVKTLIDKNIERGFNYGYNA